jgi:hypothetical protein
VTDLVPHSFVCSKTQRHMDSTKPRRTSSYRLYVAPTQQQEWSTGRGGNEEREFSPHLDPLLEEAVDFRENHVSPLWKRGARGDFDSDHSEKSPSIPLFQRGRSACALPLIRFTTASEGEETLNAESNPRIEAWFRNWAESVQKSRRFVLCVSYGVPIWTAVISRNPDPYSKAA